MFRYWPCLWVMVALFIARGIWLIVDQLCRLDDLFGGWVLADC
jgi:hypothetical protein